MSRRTQALADTGQFPWMAASAAKSPPMYDRVPTPASDELTPSPARRPDVTRYQWAFLSAVIVFFVVSLVWFILEVQSGIKLRATYDDLKRSQAALVAVIQRLTTAVTTMAV